MTRIIRVGLAAACLASAALLWPSTAAAQHRGHGHVGVGVFVGGPAFYPYYNPFYWGWYGYPWYPPAPYFYPPYGYWYDDTGSARLQVKPKETEVYVDGYFVGRVDDFDGTLQRLHIQAGEHELQLYLDGHRTVSEKVLFRRGATLKISHTMEPLAPGETSERPTPAPAAAPARGPARTPGPVPSVRRGEPNAFGALSIRVQPGDAEILVDGERWDTSEGSNRIEIELADGPHQIEIRKDGYRSYSATIRIRAGHTETLNVSLSRDDVVALH